MSESTDEGQHKTGTPVPPAGEEGPATLASPADTDDVEVVAQAAEPELQPSPRHDSVAPTSRKLAPPPKPKRDSSHPTSAPPSTGEPLASVGSLRAPSPPSISFHEAATSSPDAVAAGVTSSDSLRAIGEALAKDAGAFSATETPTGGRPPLPRARTQPGEGALEAKPRDKQPTTPDEPPVSAAPKSTSILAQRIISVGTPSERPPAALKSSSPAKSAFNPEPMPEIAERVPATSPVAEHVETAQPPLVAPAPLPVAPPLVAVPPPAAPVVAEPALEPVAPALEPVAPALEPVVPALKPVVPALEPVVSGLEPVIAVSLPVIAAEIEPALSVDIHIDEGAPEITVTADIPVTTDFDEDTPTTPLASPTPPPPSLLAEPPLAPSLPALAVDVAPVAEPVPRADAPDSVDRIPVEELSREDSPSVPPDEPPPAVPPVPSVRAEAKPPPPPKRALAPAREEIASPEVEKKKQSKQKRPWWEEMFSEDFVRASWKVSDEQIKREVTFIEESLGVAPGGVVLDLGCGSGQHAVELAGRGYGVVGYDLSLYQLALAADIAQERSQKINFLQGDMREMAFEEMFDGIFCWNTTFGYFEEDKNFSVAERAFRALRPGGMLLIDVMNRDFVAAHTPSSVWFEGDSCVCMDDAVIDYFTSRLRVKRSVILDDGRTRECTYSVRLYSFHELGKLLHEVGFRVTEVSGHPATPGVFLGQASPRILMLAQRP